MNKETIVNFENQQGLRCSNFDMTTGKVIVNDIEITSVEDWEKVTKSLVDLQQENQLLKNIIDELEKWLKENLTIERINPNGNYEPSNCKWVTMKEQQNNKRNNRLITYENQTLTMSEWADKYKIKHSTFENRLKRGYSMQEALSKKMTKRNIEEKEKK